MTQTPPSSAAVLSAILEGGNGILQTKYLYLATYTIVIYDHLLTLDLEVEYMWSRTFSVVTALFYLTRYYFLVAISFVLLLFVVPVFSTSEDVCPPLIILSILAEFTVRCERVLLFLPLGAGAPLTFFPNCIIALRIYALYERNTTLMFALSVYLLAHTGVGFWVDFTPSITRIDIFGSLGHPELGDAPAMRFCVGQVSTKLTGLQSSSYQIMQSIYDTITLSLILIKARRKHPRSKSGLVTLVAKQGLAYYILNVAIYVTWTLMLIFAPAGSKYVMGGPALGMICVSVNRLTLHLRSCRLGSNIVPDDADAEWSTSLSTPSKLRRRGSWLGASTLQVHDALLSSIGDLSTLEMHEFSCDGGSNSKV